MSLLNWLGFVVCLGGISLHVGLKAYNSKNKGPSLRQFNNRSQELELPLLRIDGDDKQNSTVDEYNDEEEE